jgi:hypothetical protein
MKQFFKHNSKRSVKRSFLKLETVIYTPRVARPELFGACQLTLRGRHDVVA